MILLVFSDNHGDGLVLDRLLSRHPDADRKISLGDSEMTEKALSDREVFGVRGNYPLEPDFPLEMVFEYEGCRTLLTHGHHYFVKSGTQYLAERARELECPLVLFGHTHQWVIRDEGDVLLVNPGSCAHPKAGGRKTYALLVMTPGRIRVEIRDAESGVPMETFVKKVSTESGR